MTDEFVLKHTSWLLDWTHSVDVRALARDPAVCVCHRLVCETGVSWKRMSDRVSVSVDGKAVGVSKDIFSFVVCATLFLSVHFPLTPSDSAFSLYSSSPFILPSHPSVHVRRLIRDITEYANRCWWHDTHDISTLSPSYHVMWWHVWQHELSRSVWSPAQGTQAVVWASSWAHVISTQHWEILYSGTGTCGLF